MTANLAPHRPLLRPILRRLAAVMVAVAMTVVSLVALSVSSPAAPAAVPTSKAPLLQRDSSVVTADALPTVQINDGYVWAQTKIGNTVYAAGSFTNALAAGAPVGTQVTPRKSILAYDITTGSLTSFAPTVNGVIRSIVASPDGSRIYIGGSFNNVNGQTRWNIAALDASTGALVPGWSPSIGGSGVYGLTIAGSTLYAGGLFTQANGVARRNLASFATANGALQPWAPTTDLQVDAMVTEPGTGKIVIAGRFYAVNGQVQRGLANLDPVTGATNTAWLAPRTVINGMSSGSFAGKAGIFGLTADTSGIYGTGWVYANAAVGNLEGVFAAEAGTGAIRWVADCHGDHYGVHSTGQTVYATSHTHSCETVNLAPEQSPRTFRYMEAFTTGARGTLSRSASAGSTYKDWSGTPSPSAYAWYPDFTVGTTSGLGQAGLSITGTGSFISVAGEFTSVNGQQFRGLVRFSTNPTSGSKQGPRIPTASWRPVASSPQSGVASVSIPSNWDRDDLNLTYDLYRSGWSSPVATVTAPSTWWNRPNVVLRDTTAPPGTNQSYTVVARDGNGNAVTSQPVSVSIAGTPLPEPQALAHDTFSRSTTSGWGSADTGGAWTNQTGTTSVLSTNGSTGQMSLAPGGTRNLTLRDAVGQDVDINVDFSLSALPSTGNSYVGVMARWIGSDYYTVRVWLRSDGSVWLITQRGGTVLASQALSGVTRAGAESYTLRTRVTGNGTTTIAARLWRSGTTEPTTWQLTTTDSTASLQAPGAVGVHGNRASTATSMAVVSFDNFDVAPLN